MRLLERCVGRDQAHEGLLDVELDPLARTFDRGAGRIELSARLLDLRVGDALIEDRDRQRHADRTGIAEGAAGGIRRRRSVRTTAVEIGKES